MTPNNNIPYVPENTSDPAAGLNLALNVIDALLQVAVVDIVNTPPGSPADGSRYLVGTAGTGAFSGHDNQLARYLDGGWFFYDARMAVNLADGNLYIRDDSGWAVVSGAAGGVVESVVAGTGVTVDSTDPANPIVSATATAAEWGDITGTLTDQTDLATALSEREHTLTAGSNITIDRTDPDAPVISATSGGTGTVESIVAGTDNVSIDSTDPANPEISVEQIAGEAAIHTTSYTLTGSLHNVFREVSGDVTITLPTEASDNLSRPNGEVYMHHVRHTGGGTVVISSTGVTLVLPAGGAASLSDAGQTITIAKSTVAANKWHVYGQTDAV